MGPLDPERKGSTLGFWGSEKKKDDRAKPSFKVEGRGPEEQTQVRGASEDSFRIEISGSRNGKNTEHFTLWQIPRFFVARTLCSLPENETSDTQLHFGTLTSTQLSIISENGPNEVESLMNKVQNLKPFVEC